MRGIKHLDSSGGLRYAHTSEQPKSRPKSSLVCGKKSHGSSQSLPVASPQRRAHLAKPPGTAYPRRNAGADGGHSPSHQSVAASLGTQSWERASAPRRLSKKKLRRRGISSVSHRLCRLLASTSSPRGCNNTSA